MGGRLDYIGSGGAAASIKVWRIVLRPIPFRCVFMCVSQVLQFFEDIGIPILEGYGLTETSPVITASKPSAITLVASTVNGAGVDGYVCASWTKLERPTTGLCGCAAVQCDLQDLRPRDGGTCCYLYLAWQCVCGIPDGVMRCHVGGGPPRRGGGDMCGWR